jgi:hypothetical protein
VGAVQYVNMGAENPYAKNVGANQYVNMSAENPNA